MNFSSYSNITRRNFKISCMDRAYYFALNSQDLETLINSKCLVLPCG